MYSPILNAIQEHINKGRISFHTPSHKGAEGSYLSFFADFLKYDLTEIPDTVGLFANSGPVYEAMELAAKAFGTAATLFSAGGCTHAIQAMLRLACKEGGKIIAGRNLHPAAVNAMALLDIDPVFIQPEMEGKCALGGRISPDAVERKLSKNKDAQVVYITSPDYFGIMSDIAAISGVAKKYGVPVIVDNAHGAHLLYAADNLHPIRLGAAMSADSSHKTLPVLTAGAWLQIADEKYKADALDAMRLFGSTSPSFPVLLSLDLCRAWLEEKGAEEFNKLKTRLESVKAALNETPFIKPEGLVDPYRIAFDASCLNRSDDEIYEFFHSRNIEPEFISRGAAVFIPSPFNTENEINTLAKAITELQSIQKAKGNSDVSYAAPHLPNKAMAIRQAVMAESEYVPIEKAKGRIAAAAEFICPPGFALTIPGEIIDDESVENLYRASIFNIKVVKSGAVKYN